MNGMSFSGRKGVTTMTEKYKWKNASEQEKPVDWWGDFLKELKGKYGEKDKSIRENGEDSEDAPTYKIDI